MAGIVISVVVLLVTLIVVISVLVGTHASGMGSTGNALGKFLAARPLLAA